MTVTLQLPPRTICPSSGSDPVSATSHNLIFPSSGGDPAAATILNYRSPWAPSLQHEESCHKTSWLSWFHVLEWLAHPADHEHCFYPNFMSISSAILRWPQRGREGEKAHIMWPNYYVKNVIMWIMLGAFCWRVLNSQECNSRFQTSSCRLRVSISWNQTQTLLGFFFFAVKRCEK